jgi:predicted ABC-type sugar transport system permease subunit
MLGALILGTLNAGMILLNFSRFYQFVVGGLLLVFAMLLQG